MMAANPFKGPEFEALFQEWNEILKKDGHEEIEDFSRGDVPLLHWDSYYFVKPSRKEHSRVVYPEDIAQVTQYYQNAVALLETHRFKTKLHRLVWALHCDGLSVRQIVRDLEFWLYEIEKSYVHEIILSIAHETGLRRER